MRIFMVTFVVFLLTLLSSNLKAQVVTSPKEAWQSLKTNPKFIAGFDTRRSFISSRDVSIFGIKVGMDFDKKVRTGFGVYFLSSPFYRNFRVSLPGTGGEIDTISAKLNFSFFCYFAEYVVLRTKRWEVGLPAYIGIGEVNFPSVPGFQKQPVLLGQLLLKVDYKILPFIGLTAGLGYRQILAGSTVIQENFNAPIYTFGIKLWLDWVAKKMFPKTFGPVEE